MYPVCRGKRFAAQQSEPQSRIPPFVPSVDFWANHLHLYLGVFICNEGKQVFLRAENGAELLASRQSIKPGVCSPNIPTDRRNSDALLHRVHCKTVSDVSSSWSETCPQFQRRVRTESETRSPPATFLRPVSQVKERARDVL